MQKFFEAVRDFIEKVRKLFKGDKAKMDNATLEEFGATVAELEKAEKLWKDLVKATAEKVKTRETKNSTSDRLTKNENDDMTDRKISYSIKDKKWHTDLTKENLITLMQAIKNDAATSINIITDKANWILTRIDGEPVFAIYSTEDLISPTLLYEAKGEQGVFERDILLNLLEAYKNGESVDGKSRIINRVSGGGWMQQSSGVENINGALGRESSNRNAGVLQGQSKGKPSRAFESVIRNIFEVQRGIETDTNNGIKFSLKKPIETKIKYSPKGIKLTSRDITKFISAVSTEYYYEYKTHTGLQYQSCVTDDTHFLVIYEDGGFGNYKPVARIDYIDEGIVNEIVEVLNNEKIDKISTLISEISESETIRRGGYSFYNAWTKKRRSGRVNAVVSKGQAQSISGGMYAGSNRDGGIGDGNGAGIKSRQGRIDSEADSKFSLKGQSDLLTENKHLQEVNEALRKEFELTKVAKVSEKSLDKFAKSLLKEYSSVADIDKIKGELNELFTYIANGEDGNPAAWDTVRRKALDISSKILKDSVAINDELYQEYKELRNRLRTTGITISKDLDGDLGRYESINDFRKANFGRIKIVKDGIGVDEFFEELCSEYPELFDKSECRNSADMLKRIDEVAESLKPFEYNPYEDSMKEGVTWLANDIISRFFDLPQAKPTFADKAKQKLVNQKIKEAKKLDRLRARKNERIAELIKKNSEKIKEVSAKERSKKYEAVAKTKAKYEARIENASERRKVSDLKKKIGLHVDKMSKMLLKGNDNSHVPEEMRRVVGALLSEIDLTTPRQKEKTINRLNALHNMYRRIAENKSDIDVEFDPDLTSHK